MKLQETVVHSHSQNFCVKVFFYLNINYHLKVISYASLIIPDELYDESNDEL